MYVHAYVKAYIYACVDVRVCAYAYVCKREQERERGRKKKRESKVPCLSRVLLTHKHVPNVHLFHKCPNTHLFRKIYIYFANIQLFHKYVFYEYTSVPKCNISC